MGNQSEVRKNFGQRASDYRLSSTHGNPVDLERMVNLLKPNPDETALDIATGGGHTAIALAKCVNKVVAVDITPEMLAEAEVATKQSGISNIEFQVEDVHNLNIPDGQFDIVASRFAAHHFFDVRKALREMCRVLKSGGKLYILDCSVFDGDEAEKEINRIEFLRDSSHQCSYSPRLWNRLLKELPLTIQHTSLLKDHYKLPQWFDRMGTAQNNQQQIFRILNNLSEDCKVHYPFGEDYITTYRFEILAIKSEGGKSHNSVFPKSETE
ncbi:class I SAM-dependent methyltransferase [Candidatus Formimonas warabiya]|uniref:class I SAM-dependent methyltransferase n=1 Tax=Formimonas warabiya TaxID=1761012 RepID=UPI0011D05106|nr:methyltransferase domain-containing protein [Candidatus Formimonas warabiya]